MVKPSRFILNTDYATLKNDDEAILTFTIPGSIVIPASGSYSNVTSHTIDIGTTGAPMRALINSSYNANLWFYGSVLQINALGSYSVIGAFTYQYWIAVTRSSQTTADVLVIIANQIPGNTLTTEATARTITVRLSSFIPPFA